MADFNSDDYEADPAPVNPHAHRGAKSIESMFETRFEDRQKTKKRMANLQDTKGSPRSVENRALVMNRFEAYLTTVRGLRANSDQYRPTGDDIARFIETIAPEMVPIRKGKPGPNLATLRNTVGDLAAGLCFKHNFTLTRQETRRIDTVLDALVKEGKLTTGTWRQRQRIGLLLLCKIGEAWFTKSLTL